MEVFGMIRLLKAFLFLFVMSVLIVGVSNNTVSAETKTIIIPTSTDFSGPYSYISKTTLPGEQAITMWWNENVGKELGVELKIKPYDMRYNPAVVSSLWPGILATDNPVLYHGLGGPDAAALMKRLPNDRVPMLQSTACYGYQWEPNLWVFTPRPTYVHEYAGFLAWVKEGWKEDRPIRVSAVSTQGVPAYEDAVKGYKSLCKETDYLEYVGTAYVKMVPVSVVNEVRHLAKKKKPDFILMLGSTSQVVTVFKAQKELGLHIPIVLSTHNDISTVNKVLPIEDIEGRAYDVSAFCPSLDHSIAAYKIFQEYKTKISPPAPDTGWDLSTLQGAAQAILGARAIERVIRKLGTDKVTGEEVYKAMYDGPFTTEELLGMMPTLEFTKEAPFPEQSMKVKASTVKDGKRVIATTEWVPVPRIKKW